MKQEPGAENFTVSPEALHTGGAVVPVVPVVPVVLGVPVALNVTKSPELAVALGA
jgi:hypothetical protein